MPDSTERVLTVRIRFLLEGYDKAKEALADVEKSAASIGASSAKPLQDVSQNLGRVTETATQAKVSADALSASLERVGEATLKISTGITRPAQQQWESRIKGQVELTPEFQAFSEQTGLMGRQFLAGRAAYRAGTETAGARMGSALGLEEQDIQKSIAAYRLYQEAVYRAADSGTQFAKATQASATETADFKSRVDALRASLDGASEAANKIKIGGIGATSTQQWWEPRVKGQVEATPEFQAFSEQTGLMGREFMTGRAAYRAGTETAGARMGQVLGLDEAQIQKSVTAYRAYQDAIFGAADSKSKLVDATQATTSSLTSEQAEVKKTTDFWVTLDQQTSGLSKARRAEVWKAAEGMQKEGMPVADMEAAIQKTYGISAAQGEHAANVEKAVNGLGKMAGAYMGIHVLQRIGMELQRAGAAIEKDMADKQNEYLKAAGQLDPLAREWNAQLAKSANANAEIGKIITQQQLPAMKEQVAQAQLMADLFAKYPALAGVEKGTGQVMGGAGTFLQYGSQAAMLALSVAQLTKAGGMLAPGGILGAGGLGGLAAGVGGFLTSPVTLGVGAGIAANQMMPERTQVGGVEVGRLDWEKLFAVMQHGVNVSIMGRDAADKYFTTIAEGKGWIDQTTAAEMNLALARRQGITEMDALKQAPTFAQGVKAYIDYQKQITNLDEQTAEQRTKIDSDYEANWLATSQKFSQQSLQMWVDYNDKIAQENSDQAFARAKEVRDFDRSESEQQKDYYDKRKDLAEKSSKDELQREIKHQHDMQYAAQMHYAKMDDYAATGDALSAFKEMRNYEIQRQHQEQQYADETTARDSNLADQLKKLDEDYTKQKVRRDEHFDQQLKDEDEAQARRRTQEAADIKKRQDQLDKERDAQMAALEETKQKTLDALDDSYKKEKDKIAGSFNDLLNTLKLQTDAAKEKYQKYFDMMGLQFEQYIGRVGAGISSLPGFEAMSGRTPTLSEIERMQREQGALAAMPTSPYQGGYPGVGLGRQQYQQWLGTGQSPPRQPVAAQAVQQVGSASGVGAQTIPLIYTANINITGSLSKEERDEIAAQNYEQAQRAFDERMARFRTGAY